MRLTRVLIVDDCHDNADSLCDLVETCGEYEARAAYSAEAAWELMQAWVPDLVFLDVVMPEVDGTALARRIKASPLFQQVRVWGVSGRVVGSAPDSGFHGMLLKPVELDRFRSILATERLRLSWSE